MIRKINLKNTLIFMTLYATYTAIYVARVNLSVASPELIKLNIADSAKIGLLGSLFSVIYALGRIVNGILSDSKPPWIMLGTGLCVIGVSNLFIGFLPPFVEIMIFWMLNAFAQSMLWSSVLFTISSIYSKEKAKGKASAMVTSVATGNIVGILLDTYLVTKFGVNYAFIIPGILTLILGVLSVIATKKIKNDTQKASTHKSNLSVIKSKSFVKMNILAVIHGVMKENISLWMAVYIVDTYFVDLTTSSFYVVLIPLIGFIGRIIYPIINKLCRNNENKIIALGFVICIAASSLLCIGKSGIFVSVLALGIIYMAVSLINTVFLSIYPLSFADTGNTASVSGIMDFSTYLGGGISSVIYGIVISSFGYLPMFLSWVLISVMSIFILKSIKKNKSTI